MFCSKCGEQQKADARFCHACGNSLDVNHEAAAAVEADAEAKPVFVNQTFSKEDELTTFVGKNAEYYKRKWAEAKDPMKRAGWNWVAFIIGPFWFGYRKMYAHVAAIIGLYLIMDILDIIMGRADSYYSPLSFVASILFGMLGNALYYQHAKKKIAQISTQFKDAEVVKIEIAKAGGTSWIGVGIVFLAMIAYVFVSAELFG